MLIVMRHVPELRHLRRIADQNDSHAQYRLAEELARQRNPSALKWYRRSAIAGHPDAQRALSYIYATGMFNVRPDQRIGPSVQR